MLECIKQPMIGVSGNCGYVGYSGLSLNGIHLNMRRIANSTDTFLQAKELLEVYEPEAITQVIKDVTLELSKEFSFSPLYDTVVKNWIGTKDDCNRYENDNPIGLKIITHCKDQFRLSRLDWIELYVDNDFTVEAVIQDGDLWTKKTLEFKRGYNKHIIDYTFINSEGQFWMRLCNGAVAYYPDSCSCNDHGICGCNKCANVYAINMIENAIIECDDEEDDTLGFFDTLKSGNVFLEPVCVPMNKNPFGFSVSCLCTYDHLFCHFQKEMAGAVRYALGIMIVEEALNTGRFNEYVEGLKERAEYYLRDWKGGENKFIGSFDIGKYAREIKSIAEMMKNYMRKSNTACISCRPQLFVQHRLPG